jgi:hypothetical protein
MSEIAANNRIRESVEKFERQNNRNEGWRISMASYREYLASIRN